LFKELKKCENEWVIKDIENGFWVRECILCGRSEETTTVKEVPVWL